MDQSKGELWGRVRAALNEVGLLQDVNLYLEAQAITHLTGSAMTSETMEQVLQNRGYAMGIQHVASLLVKGKDAQHDQKIAQMNTRVARMIFGGDGGADVAAAPGDTP